MRRLLQVLQRQLQMCVVPDRSHLPRLAPSTQAAPRDPERQQPRSKTALIYRSALQAARVRDLQSLSHAKQRSHESGCPSGSLPSQLEEDCPRQRSNPSNLFLQFFGSTIGRPSPSMRRPVDVNAHFRFLLSVSLFRFSKAASVAILPSALFCERCSLGARCLFSFQSKPSYYSFLDHFMSS